MIANKVGDETEKQGQMISSDEEDYDSNDSKNDD